MVQYNCATRIHTCIYVVSLFATHTHTDIELARESYECMDVNKYVTMNAPCNFFTHFKNTHLQRRIRNVKRANEQTNERANEREKTQ